MANLRAQKCMYKAAQYRDWEEWECTRAMTRVTCTGTAMVVLRGAARQRAGGLGSTQSMVFHVAPGERVELQVNMPETAQVAESVDTSPELAPGQGWKRRHGDLEEGL